MEILGTNRKFRFRKNKIGPRPSPTEGREAQTNERTNEPLLSVHLFVENKKIRRYYRPSFEADYLTTSIDLDPNSDWDGESILRHSLTVFDRYGVKGVEGLHSLLWREGPSNVLHLLDRIVHGPCPRPYPLRVVTTDVNHKTSESSLLEVRRYHGARGGLHRRTEEGSGDFGLQWTDLPRDTGANSPLRSTRRGDVPEK